MVISTANKVLYHGGYNETCVYYSFLFAISVIVFHINLGYLLLFRYDGVLVSSKPEDRA